jgi:chitinase
LGILIVFALTAGAVFWGGPWWNNAVSETRSPWFAGYVDVTATPTYPFENPANTAGRDVVLSFVVAAKDDPCSPSWGTHYSLDEATGDLDLDRRIARLKHNGGETIISFGGIANKELASSCTDESELVKAYSSVIERYTVGTIDLDVEGANLTDDSELRRAAAIAAVQGNQRRVGKDLAIWLTLPGAPSGLQPDGTTEIAAFLAAGVDLAGVNVMTMDYGSARASDQSMTDATITTLQSTHRQLDALYTKAGTNLSDVTLWSKIGVTPMIGQNDVADEVFSVADAKKINAFVRETGIGRVSMWSLNRDSSCGVNYVDVTRVSDACSGVEQGTASFAIVLSSRITGRPAAAASHITTAEPQVAEIADDPATSPYPIWSKDSTYLEGSKVVWHRTVYQAKWWNRAAIPDDPVLNGWETAWELIGPVLPGETPIPVVSLPVGTYPVWSGNETYVKGQRVLFEGVAFEAKWWNIAASPDAATAAPDNSPWSPLTQEQVRELIALLEE